MTTATISKTKKTAKSASKKVIPYYSKKAAKVTATIIKKISKKVQAPVIISTVVLDAEYDSLRTELKRRLHVAKIDIKRINKTLKLIKKL